MALSKQTFTNAEKTYINKIGDPKVFGPGEWWRLHEDAYWARTPEEVDVFIKGLPRRFRGLPCSDCRDNALKYLNHPETTPERYRKTVEGMFLWTFEFHNYKNSDPKLNKPILSYEQAIAPHRALEFPNDTKSETCEFCTEYPKGSNSLVSFEKGIPENNDKNENKKSKNPIVKFVK